MSTPDNDKVKHITVVPSTPAIFKVIGILLFVTVLFLVRDVILILLTALVIASAIEPGVRRFIKFGIPRVLSVIMIYLFVVGVFFALTVIFVPPMLDEVSQLSSSLPQYIENFNVSEVLPDSFSANGNLIGGELLNTLSLKDAIVWLREVLEGLSKNFFQTASKIFGGALAAVLILVISFYLAVEDSGVENFLRVILPIEHEEYAVNLWRRTRDKIGRWLQGQLILGVIVGVLVYLGLSILRVPYATSLAALATALEIIPIFGPIMSGIPAAIVAFGISPALGFMVIGLYLIIHQFENHLIYPLVVTKIVGIPPIIVIIAILVGSKLAGFLGLLLAVPVSTVLVELFNDLEKRKLSQISSSS